MAAGSQALLDAVRRGDTEQVARLVAAEPALAAACDERQVSAVRLALYHGDPEAAATLGAAEPPLDVFDAAAVGDCERLRDLLDSQPAGVNAYAADGLPRSRWRPSSGARTPCGSCSSAAPIPRPPRATPCACAPCTPPSPGAT